MKESMATKTDIAHLEKGQQEIRDDLESRRIKTGVPQFSFALSIPCRYRVYPVHPDDHPCDHCDRKDMQQPQAETA